MTLSPEKRRLVFAALICLALYVAYGFLAFAAPSPHSPDEASNRYFSEVFADAGKLWTFDLLQQVVPDVVHPRSTRIVDGLLVPGGFLGMPVLYGAVGALLGNGIIPFLTPFVAVLGVAGWFGVVATVFGRRIGLVAAALLMFHPAWWYAASRTMLPGMLFITLLIGAAWFALAAPVSAILSARGLRTRLLHRIDPVMAGILCGLALAVRPAEAHWVAFVTLAIALPALWRPAGRRDVALFAAAFALAVMPFLYLHHVVYGNVFASGYGQGVSVPTGESMQGFGNKLLGPLRPYLFPLGFAPRTALRNFWTYGVAYFWWWSALFMCGLWAWRKAVSGAPVAWKRFGLIGVLVSLWLILFYGSWQVQDNPDPNAITIGSSYLRYWLPIFAFSTVPVALLFERIAGRFGRVRGDRLMAAVLSAIAVLSGAIVFGAPGEGMFALRATHQRYERVIEGVLERVPDAALVVADRADKYFLGKRTVMSPLRAESTYDALPKLAARAEIYYFGITLPEGDLAYLRGTILGPRGLDIEPVETFDHETLYRFTRP